MKEQELKSAFKQMWGHYPAPVMLLRRDHVIIGTNRAAETAGIPEGINCYTLAGRDKICAHCKAAKARRSGTGIRETAFSQSLGRVMDGFWIPLDGNEDYYVHFGNDVTEFADPKRFPEMETTAG